MRTTIGSKRRLACGLSCVMMMAMMTMAASAHAGTRIEKRLPLGPGGRFMLDTQIGSVTLRGDSGSGVVVVVTSSRDDLEKLYDLSFDSTPGQVRVTAKRKGPRAMFTWGEGSHGGVHFAISVPRRTSVALHASGGSLDAGGIEGNAEVGSSGGSVTLQQVAGEVTVEASGGSVELRGIRGNVRFSSSGGGLRAASVQGSITGDASGGSVELEQVAGDIHVGSSGGGVHIKDAGGRVMAGSSGGDVEVRFAAGNAKGGKISSSGGGIEVQVDPNVGLDLAATSSGGGVTCDLPVTVQGKVSRSSLHGLLKGGGEKLAVESSGGGVRISPR